MPGQSIVKIIKDIGFPALTLFAAWGGAAMLSLTLAVMALLSDTGSQRLARAMSGTPAGQSQKEQPQVGQLQTEQLIRWQTEQLIKSEEIAREKVAEETGRLADTMRGLAADRDRLLARVTALEHNLEDVTGSIARRPDTPRASPLPASPPSATAFATMPLNGPTALNTAAAATLKPAAPIPASASAPASFDAPIAVKPVAVIAAAPAAVETAPQSAGSVGTTTEFGVDIGGGATISALRDLWSAARSNHGKTLEGLRPFINIHEAAKGTIVLRLVAGPLGNAGVAAKICATLAASGWSCKPVPFDGQKLALR